MILGRTAQKLDDHIEECGRLRQGINNRLDQIDGKLDQLLTEKDERVGAQKAEARQEQRQQLSRGERLSIWLALLSSTAIGAVNLVEYAAKHLHWVPVP